MHWEKGVGWDGVYIGPEEEPIAAVALLLRFFVQNNESTSLQNMAEAYSALGVHADLAREFVRLRQEVNDGLAQRSNFAIDVETMTYREIFHVFMWGDLAHSGQEATYRAIADSPLYPAFRAEFVSILRWLIRMLLDMREVNKRALAELQTTDAS